MDACTPLETLHGNDEHATSRSDCLPYLSEFPVRNTPVSVEENASSFSYDALAPPFHSPGSRLDTPGSTPQLVDGLLAFLLGVWTDAREVGATCFFVGFLAFCTSTASSLVQLCIYDNNTHTSEQYARSYTANS